MRCSQFRYSFVLFTLIYMLLFTGCSLFGDNSSTGSVATPSNNTSPVALSTVTTAVINPAVNAVELDMLNNIKTYGFNADPTINGGLGGLWVNWRYGTSPLQTNVNGTGETDEMSGNSVRHDPLTDLRYLHDLWLYKAQNPTDNRFESEITRYTPIVKYEYKNSHDTRGWLYDEFVGLYSLSHDSFYKDTAASLATGFAKAFNPTVGSIFKPNSSGHDQGSYRVDLTLEAGCALVQAGTLFDNPQWTQEGLSTIKFIYDHAYISQYHIFPDQMDNVLNGDGSVNAQEQFFSGQSNSNGSSYAVKGGQTQLGNISQIVTSLLDTYQMTHTQDFLAKATDLLDALSLPNNSLAFGIVPTVVTTLLQSSLVIHLPNRVQSRSFGRRKRLAVRQLCCRHSIWLINLRIISIRIWKIVCWMWRSITSTPLLYMEFFILLIPIGPHKSSIMGP